VLTAYQLIAPTTSSSAFYSCARPLRTRSPLFPYTTLFRSEARVDRRDHGPRLRVQGPPQAGALGFDGPRSGGGRGQRGERGGPGDRKSTRLNSSHVAISYAAFCLKKKTGTRCIGG